MSVYNPRFPHRCKIYRVSEVSPFHDGTKEIIYVGACRKYPGYRATDPDGVAKELFALSLPVIYRSGGKFSISQHASADDIEEISSTAYPSEGDVLEIETPIANYTDCRITQIMAGNLGTTIHWEDVKR